MGPRNGAGRICEEKKDCGCAASWSKRLDVGNFACRSSLEKCRLPFMKSKSSYILRRLKTPFAKPQVISSLDASFFSMPSWPFSQSFHFDHAFPSGPKIFSLLMLVDHTLAGHARLATRLPVMCVWPRAGRLYAGRHTLAARKRKQSARFAS